MQASSKGIIQALGEMNPGTLVTEAALARIMEKSEISVKRAVRRGELPPPVKLMGKPTWTAGFILKFMENRLEQAGSKVYRKGGKVCDG